ncbi:hypothetical protein BGW36DRAFT_358991 [Talaromyces proteolyticus]|uniref:Uncharacterized protein n=1 Tax=Talaromyces proteolyticus TaxID=1131652 RepID=A0AAD4Q0H6_9EURO|nr:uncharacterized protein BGW36DRAFT_358991 [Talaromyces proteolyticus]KAH8697188.1 hypothetical protein BGW36DRAFT_358991 [Talaromyces proteolyticus]
MFFPKLSIAILAALAAVGESRHGQHLHPKYPLGTGSQPASIAHPTTTIYSSITLSPVPLGTGVPSGPGRVYTTVTDAHDVTLTYTLGTGTSTSVVTTTIHRTATETTYVTITPGGQAPGGDDSTTTLSTTSTSTTTVTVLAAETTSSGSGSGPGSGSNGEGCSGQATVTVTERETVTVTASQGVATSAGFTTPVAPNAVVTTTAKPSSTYTEPDCDEPTTTPDSPKATETTSVKLPPAPSTSGSNNPTSVPYPISTIPQTTYLASSGFLTSKKPLPTGFGLRFRD